MIYATGTLNTHHHSRTHTPKPNAKTFAAIWTCIALESLEMHLKLYPAQSMSWSRDTEEWCAHIFIAITIENENNRKFFSVFFFSIEAEYAI